MSEKASPTPRRRVDATSSVARIIAASRHVFGSGNGRASLDDIAAEAGVGIATLYRHFPNREALARGVYADLLDTEILPLLEEAAGAASPRTALLGVFSRLLDLVTAEQGLIVMAGNFAELTAETLTRMTVPLHRILIRGQELGEIRGDLTVEDIPRFLVMAVAGLTLPGTAQATRRRLLVLMFDALNPVSASPLPPSDAAADNLGTAIRSMGPR